MKGIQSKKQQGRHRAFLRAVRKNLTTACPVISDTEISRYLGRYMDVNKAAEAFISNLNANSVS
jgi:hypothetical protein